MSAPSEAVVFARQMKGQGQLRVIATAAGSLSHRWPLEPGLLIELPPGEEIIWLQPPPLDVAALERLIGGVE